MPTHTKNAMAGEKIEIEKNHHSPMQIPSTMAARHSFGKTSRVGIPERILRKNTHRCVFGGKGVVVPPPITFELAVCEFHVRYRVVLE